MKETYLISDEVKSGQIYLIESLQILSKINYKHGFSLYGVGIPFVLQPVCIAHLPHFNRKIQKKKLIYT